MASPPRSKGKGRAPVQELDLGEVTGVICHLCEKKGIPCRWSKVSSLLFLLMDLFDSPHLGLSGLPATLNKVPH